MGRIRTIKPEFPQSESLGRVSREARLFYVNLWTLADDSGKARGDSRFLARTLYPYDEDVTNEMVEMWISELEKEDHVAFYCHEGSSYFVIPHWRIHQRIDRPTASKLPEFDESSRILASPRVGNGREWKGRDQEGSAEGNLFSEPKTRIPRTKPEDGISEDDLLAFCSAWNENCGDMAKAEVLENKRRVHIKARLREVPDLNVWAEAAKRASKSDFLSGRSGKWRGNIDWFLRPGTLTKIQEGQHDNKNRY